MGTNVRAELSENSRWWIGRHRYYELKHFCLQYPTWKKAHAGLEGLAANQLSLAAAAKNGVSDPTGKCVEAKSFFFERVALVERCAKAADEGLAKYILAAVTEGLSYDTLRARLDIPCCKEAYYTLYRKFFWILNCERE